jgi:dipeptidyl aminopeptidase/acylaminoacyl peptidase
MQKFEERQSIVFENEGQRIFGIVHLPLTPPPHPGVLFCHGLGGHKTGKFRLYVMLSEMLAKRGIASMRFDFRGSGDSEGEFSDTTLEGEVKDAQIALDTFRSLPSIDSSRIGLFGRSFGGTVALMIAKTSGPVKSLATWAPLFDGDQWVEQWQTLHAPGVPEEYRHEALKINGQVPGNNFFKELFQMRIEEYLKDIEHLPLLHIHGEKDNIVTIDHADKYYEARGGMHHNTKFIRLPHSDHDFSHSKEQFVALDETVKWFTDTL